ncbi:hypothetical protein SHJG_8720 [Streptomyces hygroscopicus subsp. jinggangensis 5008]|nr:hypothetical protein SHJG_8720 [Streptomyces hygroscopicus subsp. jinggangensis 5008]AGF68140.1 hypothetical protein SHJGH_8478 [Streptomyces hygroscopicus subsp. jinggangensis TL01]
MVTCAGGAGMNGDVAEEQLRLRQAAEVLRGQLSGADRPPRR